MDSFKAFSLFQALVAVGVLLVVPVAWPTHAQMATAILAAMLTVVDWRQTLVIADNPARWRELNPLMPDHPTRTHVHLHFAAGFLLCTALLLTLGDWLRWLLLATVATVELICIVNNTRQGIRL